MSASWACLHDGAAFDERLLNGILQRLRFRGPDAQNIFVERHLAFCFSFLSETVLGVAVPTRLAADVARDALVHSLSLQVARLIRKYGQGHWFLTSGYGIAETQTRTGPQSDHGPAPEDCVLSLQIRSMTLGANVFLRRWEFHAQVQRALIAEHAQRQ
jgi:hypothetical protein